MKRVGKPPGENVCSCWWCRQVQASSAQAAGHNSSAEAMKGSAQSHSPAEISCLCSSAAPTLALACCPVLIQRSIVLQRPAQRGSFDTQTVLFQEVKQHLCLGKQLSRLSDPPTQWDKAKHYENSGWSLLPAQCLAHRTLVTSCCAS